MAGCVVCFGELLLRLNAPGHERFLQSQRFDVQPGGAEANVAVALARFGHDARMVSVAPANPLGDGVVAALRREGVDVTGVRRASGRMGLYFMETGAVSRPSRIVYDRAHSAFAEAPAETYDWPALLEGADWLHVSGITPAVGPRPAEAALAAVSAAGERGVGVSFDGNYRAALWESWSGDGPAILSEVLSHARLAFINERDVGLILGAPKLSREAAIAQAFEAFPSLEYVAATTRAQSSVSDQALAGALYLRGGEVYASAEFALAGVVDRIGSGDAFAAGMLHALIQQRPYAEAAGFAAAAAAVKHSIPGDWCLATEAEIEEVMNGGGLDVRR